MVPHLLIVAVVNGLVFSAEATFEANGIVKLEIHLAGSMAYVVDAVPACGTERRTAA